MHLLEDVDERKSGAGETRNAELRMCGGRWWMGTAATNRQDGGREEAQVQQ